MNGYLLPALFVLVTAGFINFAWDYWRDDDRVAAGWLLLAAAYAIATAIELTP